MYGNPFGGNGCGIYADKVCRPYLRTEFFTKLKLLIIIIIIILILLLLLLLLLQILSLVMGGGDDGSSYLMTDLRYW
jgi:hypothetical protein